MSQNATELANAMGRRRRPNDAGKTALQSVPTGPTSRLSVDIPRDLMKRVKPHAVEEDTTIREIVIEVLEERLNAGD